MNVTIDVLTLLSALRVVGPALARTNSFRKPSCELSAADGQVTLRAASLDWNAQYTMPARVTTAGHAWMAADMLRALPVGQFTEPIRIRSGSREIEIRSGSIAYTLALLETESIGGLNRALIPCADAKGSTLARVLLLGASAGHQPAAGKDEDGGAVVVDRDGAWVEVQPGRVTVSSTDRTRVASASTAATSAAQLRAALPIHAAIALGRAAAQAEAATLLRSKRDPSPALSITAGAAAVTVRTLAALPPDPTALDLDVHRLPTKVRVAADRITAGLRAALAIAGTDPHATVRLCGRRAHLDIQATAGDSRAAVTVALEHASGPEADVTLPARPLLAVLAPLGGAEVTLALKETGGPVTIAATDGPVIYRGLIAAASERSHTVRRTGAVAGD